MSVVPIHKRRITEKRDAIRTRTFTGYSIEDLRDQLKAERFTGRIIVDMSQGGVNSMQVEDRASLVHLTRTNN